MEPVIDYVAIAESVKLGGLPFLVPLITAAITGGASYLAGRDAKKAQQRANAQQFAQQQAEFDAKRAADLQVLQLQQQKASEQAAVQARQFAMERQASESERERQKEFSQNLAEFGEEKKAAELSQAKEKRKQAAVGAAKGVKQKGTSLGRVGKSSPAFTRAARKAYSRGLQRAANRMGPMAALTAWGPDAAREAGLLSDEAAAGAATGINAANTRRLGQLYGSLVQPGIDAKYAAAMNAARLRGDLPPFPPIYADTSSPWQIVGAGAQAFGSLYPLFKK